MIGRLLALRFLISTQLYVVLGGAVALTVAASLVGWFSFSRVGEVQSRVTDGSVPELEAAFRIAQHSNTLVTAAPRLVSAANFSDLAVVELLIANAYMALEDEIASLEQSGTSRERIEPIRERSNALVNNIEEIEVSMEELFAAAADVQGLRDQLTTVNTRLDATVVPAVDDQYFYTITGFRSLDRPPDDPALYFSNSQVTLYRNLSEIQAEVNIAVQLLVSAFSISEQALIEPLLERFETVAARIKRRLGDIRDPELRGQLNPTFDWLFELGMGEANGFELRARELGILERQQELLDANSELNIGLVDKVDGLVNSANANVQEATEASTQAIFTGRVLLIAIGAASVLAALLLAWQYVGRVLLSRLQILSNRMRSMARGDLETKVEISGKDEVADMAAALEIFRQHALEVQRLNLVEMLAEELQGKNDELESVLADLQVAQDQIVMREKLAALGELTAGVAHEIRNPLNFINNFSEVSAELLEELREVLEKGGELGPEDRSYIQEISDDLNGNLERIQSHGGRANRIVNDMLQMGRGGGDHQPTNINNLLNEFATLAYHSARATDPDFQLTIERDLEEDIADIEAIPQDLGRVFLNIVSNACHATDQRRRASLEAGNGVWDYIPTITLTTRREGDMVQVRIRDNGSGIPDDIVEKIFNPFFTTKPTNQGTGLGLAISSDIVRQHGGTISVESEPGQFTEMTVALPFVMPAKTEDEEEPADEIDDEDDASAEDDGDGEDEEESPSA
ncbi:MAG: ATP-binding protein [Chloroflexota bacterium]|nr:ATP-binding protein [Chloroflexota bacterium]MDE2941176.1 ATP-binding protein [Chloroflexota bacterium]MDE3267055.1 ATP-binding protein [Chloroflexota bacterium]